MKKKLKERWHEIACIIVEPLLGNQASIMPQDGFLDFVRAQCDKYGIVMIIDEVKTGFRIAKGGAQEYFNVKADLVTYAKCLGNGFPAAAIAGQKHIMGEVGPGKIPHGGIFGANVVAMSAADKVLDLIDEGELEKVNDHGKKLKAGWKKILDAAGTPYVIQGPDAMPGIVFTEESVCTEYTHWANGDHVTYDAIIDKCIEKGVMSDCDSREPWFISSCHTDDDLDFVLDVFEKSVKEVLKKEEMFMGYGIISTIPAFFLVIYIFKTKRILESLIFASLLGFIIIHKFGAFGAFMESILNVGMEEDTVWLFVVCGIMGSIIALIEVSGGAHAFGEWVSKRAKTRKSTLMWTWMLGVLIFIDDYLNSLTVGSCMAPVTDKHKVSREFLSYVVVICC